MTWRREYPADLEFKLRRMTGSGDLWVTENLISYNGSPFMFTLNVLKVRGDRVAHEYLYVMEGFEAADFRAEYATRFDPLASVAPADYREGVAFGLDLELVPAAS